MPDQFLESTIDTPRDGSSLAIYVCPACKGGLVTVRQGLYCAPCALTYPLLDGIPNFILEDLAGVGNRSLRTLGRWDSSRAFNFMARHYETHIYPLVCNLFAGWHSTSLKQLAQEVSDVVEACDGLILDVACGPGTYGRRVASASRTVYGIDACMSMLRQGMQYLAQEGNPNVHLSRAKVEALPFRDRTFDAAICAGSLNHFSDTVLALREIGRTMKPAAPLVVTCFAGTRGGLMGREFMRNRMARKGARIFDVAELGRCAVEAGFENFSPRTHGTLLVFSARKKAAERSAA